MSWDGYFTYAGAEIINAPRTEAYAHSAGKHWFRPVYKKPEFAQIIEQDDYLTPVLDGAPWVDPDVPESYDFYGFYPLSIDGLENATRSSTVTEYTTDGGNPGRLRHGTKTVVFSGLLVAGSEAAAKYGMDWLKRVLLGSLCDPAVDPMLGADLTYFASEPIDDTYVPDDEIILDGGTADSAGLAKEYASELVNIAPIRGLLRTARRMVFNNGPSLLTKVEFPCGGNVWTVQFTGVGGSPYEFGVERPILQGFGDPSVTNPWVPGSAVGTFDATGAAWTEVPCGTDTWAPIYDPLCTALIVPPGPPAVPLGCYAPPATWSRRKVTIPAANVPLWGEVVPVLTVHAPTELRNVRVRFYDDPTGSADPDETPCDFSGDVVMSYIPPGGTMVIDGALQQVFVLTELGQRRRADSLVFATDGTPFDWPALGCGYGHILTVDVPQGSALPVIDLSLVPRVV